MKLSTSAKTLLTAPAYYGPGDVVTIFAGTRVNRNGQRQIQQRTTEVTVRSVATKRGKQVITWKSNGLPASVSI